MVFDRAWLRFGEMVLIAFLFSGCFFGGGRGSNVTTGNETTKVNLGDLSNFEGTGGGERRFADGIAATVNGRVITKSEVREAVAQQRFLISRQEVDPAERERKIREVERDGLKAMIDRELLLEEYDKIGVPVKEQHVDAQVGFFIREAFGGDRNQFIDELRRQRMTLRRFREEQVKQIKVMRMRGAITQNRAHSPTPSEIQRYYQEHINDFREEGQIKVRTITIPKLSADPLSTPTSQRLLASDILKKLRNGADFAEMARTYSSDPAARDGGDRGFIERGTLNPLLDEAAFRLKPGEISNVIEGPTTYIILWAEERRYGRTAPLEEAREQIELRITQEQRKQLVDDWVAARRKRAMIKIY